jgi:hypothetical protein
VQSDRAAAAGVSHPPRQIGLAFYHFTEPAAAGWDIGSGPTEAQCKTMAARLKGSGMRWDPANAAALLALSAVADSGEWSAYWRGQGIQWN